MATVVGPPILDDSLQRALLGFAQPLGQGLAAGAQNRALQQFALQQGINVPQGLPPQLAQALIAQQFDPFDAKQAQVGLATAQTGLAEARTGQVGVQQPFSLPAGGGRFTPEGGLIAERPFAPRAERAPTSFEQEQTEIGRISAIPKDQRTVTEQARLDQLLGRKPPTGFKIVNQLIDDPDSPTGFSVKQFNQTGEQIGRRFATRKEVLQGVPEGAITKPTVTKIEKDVIDLNTTLAELDAIEKQINPDFFTFRGKGKAFFTALAEKSEIPISQAAKEFLGDKTKFFADSKRVFLKFRKFITGVAGGIEEFREIAKATIDPEGDSETEFRNKFKSMRDNALRTKNVLLAMRNSGIDPQNPANRKRVFSGLSLSNISLDVSPNINLQTLEAGQPGENTRTSESQAASDEEILRILGLK